MVLLLVVVTLAGCSDVTAVGESQPPPVFDSAFGTSEHSCVDVDSIVEDQRAPEERFQVIDVRSGEIVGGNFVSVVGNWAGFDAGGVKIYWVPLDPERARTSDLVVTVMNLAAESTVEESVQTFPGGRRAAIAELGHSFWATEVVFAEPGRYRLEVEAEDHFGCFEVTV